MVFEPGTVFCREFVVDARVYEGFLATFGDRNPLHVDAAYARAHGFADRVMHGNLLNGFLSYFVGECLPVKEVMLHKQEIRYLRPVYEGDTLTLEATVESFSEAVRAVEMSYRFANQAGVKVASGKLQFGVLA